MLNRTERNRVLTYAKVAYKKETAVKKLFAKKEEKIKKVTEECDKKIQNSTDYLEYTMNLNMMRTLLKNPEATPSDVIEEVINQKEIMGNMCNTRSYKPTAAFLSQYCGITAEEVKEDATPSMATEAAEEIAEDVEADDESQHGTAEEAEEPANDDTDIPEDLTDDF